MDVRNNCLNSKRTLAVCCTGDMRFHHRTRTIWCFRIHTMANRTRILGHRAVRVRHNDRHGESNVLRGRTRCHHTKGTARSLVPK